MPLPSPIKLFGSQTGAISSFTNFPQWVKLGVTSQWLDPDVGTNVAPIPGDWLIAFMNAFSVGPVPDISDGNANTWTKLQSYGANGEGIGVYSAVANASLSPDEIDFATGAWGANAAYLVFDIDAALGAFTTAYGTSSGATISATTASGYTLTLDSSGTFGTGPGELFILEWGGGVAQHTYRLAWQLAAPAPGTPPAGWTRVDDLYTYPAEGFLLGRAVWVFDDRIGTGNIVIAKATVPTGSSQSFEFTPSYGSVFDLSDGETNDSGPLAPGTYQVLETPIPGWTTATSQDPTNIVVVAGETTTVTFTNTLTPLPPPPVPPSTCLEGAPLLDGNGQPRAPQVMLRWSDDAGKTWSNTYLLSCGKVGEFQARARKTQLGRARRRVWEVSGVDAIPWRLADAYVEATPSTAINKS